MTGSILVITEQRLGALNPQSLETIAGARKIAALTGGGEVIAAIVGQDVAGLVQQVAEVKPDRLLVLEHPLLEPYSADAHCAAVATLVEALAPTWVVFPHTYQARDFAPRLAARFKRSLIADCIGVKAGDGQPLFVRQMFQGKTNADVATVGDGPYFVSFQAGAFGADEAVGSGDAPAPERHELTLTADQIRVAAKPPEASQAQSVDLSKAPIIVAVGRGIQDADNIEIAEQLAKALGGELGASRPVCDAGWLPIERQIGSSGQTVAPKLYLVLGISGASQHLVGMKGAQFICAVNKDPNAPIFKVADYGLVGDALEIVPELIKAL